MRPPPSSLFPLLHFPLLVPTSLSRTGSLLFLFLLVLPLSFLLPCASPELAVRLACVLLRENRPLSTPDINACNFILFELRRSSRISTGYAPFVRLIHVFCRGYIVLYLTVMRCREMAVIGLLTKCHIIYYNFLTLFCDYTSGLVHFLCLYSSLTISTDFLRLALRKCSPKSSENYDHLHIDSRLIKHACFVCASVLHVMLH